MTSVDILIPNRNYGKFLSQAIDSCLQQTHKNVNIIVADDNSCDNSREILRDRKDVSVILINDDSPSIAKTRNILIGASTSPYVCFLSSDDYFRENFLETSLAMLNSHSSPDVGGVYGTFMWVTEDGTYDKPYGYGAFASREALHASCCEPRCIVSFESSLFKREVFMTGQRFDPEVIYGEETHFIACITRKYHFIKNTLADYVAFKRCHGDQGHTLYTEQHRITLTNKIRLMQSSTEEQ